MRTPDLGAVPTWQVSADVEALAWDPHNPTQFVVSAEDGVVAAYDARQGANSAPLYQLGAHEKATSCLSFCPAVRGLLATASTDKKVGGPGGVGGCDVGGWDGVGWGWSLVWLWQRQGRQMTAGGICSARSQLPAPAPSNQP